MKSVALIGPGYFGEKLLERFIQFSNVKYVCSRNLKNLEKLKEKFKVNVATNYLDVLDDVDLVVIATPTKTHFKIAKDCILARKEIFIEKPLSLSFSESDEIIKLAKEKNVSIYVDNVFTFREEFQKLKNLISNKKIKKISCSWKKYGSFKDSIFNNLFYHDLYLINNLANESKISNIYIKSHDKEFNKINFTFKLGEIFVEINYDRLFDGKEKVIEVETEEDTFVWKNSQLFANNEEIEINQKDALSYMVQRFLIKKINFIENNKQALFCSKIIDRLNEIIKN